MRWPQQGTYAFHYRAMKTNIVHLQSWDYALTLEHLDSTNTRGLSPDCTGGEGVPSPVAWRPPCQDGWSRQQIKHNEKISRRPGRESVRLLRLWHFSPLPALVSTPGTPLFLQKSTTPTTTTGNNILPLSTASLAGRTAKMEQSQTTDQGATSRIARLGLTLYDKSPGLAANFQGTDALHPIQIDDDSEREDDSSPESYWPPGLPPTQSRKQPLIFFVSWYLSIPVFSPRDSPPLLP